MGGTETLETKGEEHVYVRDGLEGEDLFWRLDDTIYDQAKEYMNRGRLPHRSSLANFFAESHRTKWTCFQPQDTPRRIDKVAPP